MCLIAKISQIPGGNLIGRIGGNIPEYFLDKKEDINNYNFYISFQNPQNTEEYISIFVPKNYEDMINSNIYPNCSIKVFNHAFSEESDDVEYTIEYINKSSIIGYKESAEFNFITYSKHPRLIQEENYYINDLQKDGYAFFMQIDEDYYPENLINGNYIFGYGALYLYRNITNNEIIAGFWQYS